MITQRTPAAPRAPDRSRRRLLVALVAVLALGATLRLVDSNWDAGAHLHPDERYLSMVADQLRVPGSPAEYFDVERSPLSPYNTESGRAYPYGQLPLLGTKLIAAAVGQDGYDRLYVVGRVLSAALDTLSILLVYLLGRALFAAERSPLRARAALLAAAFYALSVTAIQHAHFFTMESWLACFSLLTVWLASRLAGRSIADRAAPALLWPAAVGASLGLAVASKISGLALLGPVLVALLIRSGRARSASLPARALALAASLLVVIVSAYVTFRAVSPYAFEHSSWLDAEPNAAYRAALEAQQSAQDGVALLPPAYQWLLSTPLASPAWNMALWGLGALLGAAALAGLALLAVDLGAEAVRRARRWGVTRPGGEEAAIAAALLLAVVVPMWAYFGSRFAHAVRYLLPTVGFLCLAAAYALVWLWRRHPRAGAVALAAVLASTALYATAFLQVYRGAHPRIAATRWLNAHVPPGSLIAGEAWDDMLPVGGSDRFRLRELAVYDPDEPAKLDALYRGLAGADYYVLSSPRAWRSIGRLPDRFPLMARFYDQLLDERLGYERVAAFRSSPRLLGVTLDDLGAEEPFWVYDHPPVLVLRRDGPLSWERFRAALCPRADAPGCAQRTA